ncbi:hypothetical protein Tco_0652435 [Tanacetum coccineum]|uniref:Uncharacterized protein n=1 Tax=Tanacetum coccineum TaxID=301880 RepID=A0ABQ4WXM1_9ASTR
MMKYKKPLKKKETNKIDEELAFKLQSEEEEQARIVPELVKESSKKAKAEMAQESSSKRARKELEQEVAKKQKMKDDKEKEDLKQRFEIIQDDEVAIDAIPLATKHAPIVNFQIQ